MELHWCDRCREYRKAVAERDFDREDAFEDRSWGPILWDLGALPAEHPFAEAA